MKHLSREELIDSLEHALPPAREAHVDACPSCRAERGSLQQVLARVASVEVPEPSPLFWEHFSARVREQVARQPATAAAGWHAWSWPRWIVAAATLVVCVTLGVNGLRSSHRARVVETSGNASLTNDAVPIGLEPFVAEAGHDDDWNLVVRMAEDVTLDDADEPGLSVRPAATDGALTDLSSEQRSELARLLTAEMTRPAS
jgi:hypothetical protein